MERPCDDPSVVLLSINDKPVGDNNNISELTVFQKKMESLEEASDPPVDRSDNLFKQPRLRIPILVAGAVFIGVAVIVTAVFLIIKFAVPTPEVSGHLNQTTGLPPVFSTSSSPSSRSSTLSPTNISTSSPLNVTISSGTSVVTAAPNVTFSSTASDTVTTPSTTTVNNTTIFPPCEEGEFQCSDGSCIGSLQVCDGKVHCPAADDEQRGCNCSVDQFRCSSGQCVASKYRCDGTPHCEDLSDEVKCENCHGYECDSGLCTWSIYSRCDGIIQCLDLSDEKNCKARWGSRYCKNGIQIPANQWCNGIDECFDNTDETNCTQECSIFEGKRWCEDGKTCILRDWFCDGFNDCPDGTDESNCRRCSSDQVQCKDNTCVDKSRICDGFNDCISGLDEADCLTLKSGDDFSETTGVVMVRTFDSHLPVCSDHWSEEVANEVCFYFGHGVSIQSEFISMATAGVSDAGGYMGAGDKDPAHNQTVLVRFDKVSSCQSKKVVQLACTPRVCGERKLDYLTPFIVGGKLVHDGKWPWVASVSRLGADICGGVLLNQNWVLTAAHCVVTNNKNYTQVPHFFNITVGSNHRNISNNPKAQRRLVDRIVMHGQAERLVSGNMQYDMVLLHFSQPVIYGDYVQPVCLPEQSQSFSVKSVCFLAGWGKVNPLDLTVDHLRDAKMKLWDEEICRADVMSGETSVDTNHTICAGWATGAISACPGDSGGPLMCLDVRGRWTVIGVMSSGVSVCNAKATYKASRYAKVASSTEWIESVVENR